MKIYYLARISVKILKGIPNNPNEKNLISDYYINDNSNMLSIYEAIILRWVEINDEIIRPNKAARVIKFDQNFKDCKLFASIL